MFVKVYSGAVKIGLQVYIGAVRNVCKGLHGGSKECL